LRGLSFSHQLKSHRYLNRTGKRINSKSAHPDHHRALDLEEKVTLAEHLARAIPNARHTVIAAAAHLMSMEQPTEFNRLVLSFLASL
ncbi:MAG: hypothetical protein IT329_06230, partial [Caldilineaceae bacterium]|nr:hypothetical protein [Caldilineaceae bacterium]